MADAGRVLSPERLAEVRSSAPLSLFCDYCGSAFITYDPNAERGHALQLGAVLDDAARHAKECRDA